MSRDRPKLILPTHTGLLACRVLEPEFTDLGIGADQVTYLDQGLHRYPKDLREMLQQEIARFEEKTHLKRLILGYGLCGGGLEEICSRRLELVIPLVHDCIPLLLGSDPAATPIGCGASFFLSPGWIDHGKTPLSEYHVTARKFGHEDALWAAKQMLKGYSEVVLIRTVAGVSRRHQEYAQRMAELFGLAYREMTGSHGRLAELLAARKTKILTIVEPGRAIRSGLYPQTVLSPADPAGRDEGVPCTSR